LHKLLSVYRIEFINLISSQANEVCNKHEKTKICADHLYEALQELGFQDFIGELKSIGEEITSGKKEKSSKKAAKKVSGKSDEQLRKEQEEKFALARSRTGSSLSTLAQNPESSENVFGDDDEDLDDIDDDDE
jgi:hypothetical protein